MSGTHSIVQKPEYVATRGLWFQELPMAALQSYARLQDSEIGLQRALTIVRAALLAFHMETPAAGVGTEASSGTVS